MARSSSSRSSNVSWAPKNTLSTSRTPKVSKAWASINEPSAVGMTFTTRATGMFLRPTEKRLPHNRYCQFDPQRMLTESPSRSTLAFPPEKMLEPQRLKPRWLRVEIPSFRSAQTLACSCSNQNPSIHSSQDRAARRAATATYAEATRDSTPSPPHKTWTIGATAP